MVTCLTSEDGYRNRATLVKGNEAASLVKGCRHEPTTLTCQVKWSNNICQGNEAETNCQGKWSKSWSRTNVDQQPVAGTLKLGTQIRNFVQYWDGCRQSLELGSGNIRILKDQKFCYLIPVGTLQKVAANNHEVLDQLLCEGHGTEGVMILPSNNIYALFRYRSSRIFCLLIILFLSHDWWTGPLIFSIVVHIYPVCLPASSESIEWKSAFLDSSPQVIPFYTFPMRRFRPR